MLGASVSVAGAQRAHRAHRLPMRNEVVPRLPSESASNRVPGRAAATVRNLACGHESANLRFGNTCGSRDVARRVNVGKIVCEHELGAGDSGQGKKPAEFSARSRPAMGLFRQKSATAVVGAVLFQGRRVSTETASGHGPARPIARRSSAGLRRWR